MSSCDESPSFELGGRALDAVIGDLFGQPFGELSKTGAKIHARHKAEFGATALQVRKAMTNIAGTVPAKDMRRDVRAIEHLGQILGDGKHGALLARTDIEGAADSPAG